MPTSKKNWEDLDAETQEFLAQLRPGEVSLLKDTIQFMRSAQVMGKFFKYVIWVVMSSFIGVVMFGESLKKLWDLITGEPK